MASAGVTVWLPFWGFRKKYALDYKLERTAQYVRWSVVGLCLILDDFGIVPPGKLAGTLAIIFLAFIAWPNLAYYLTRPFRRRPGSPGDVADGRNIS